MTTDNKTTRRYRKRGHDNADDDDQRDNVDIEHNNRRENNELKRDLNLNLAHRHFSHYESHKKYEAEERPRKIARRNVLADDDTDGVFGGDWGSSSLRESETEREQYDKQRESTYEERKEALKPNYSVPPLYSIHKGKVVGIKEFGIFVELPGYSRHGLVHISQISNYRTEDINGVVEKGDEIWVKIIKIIEDYKDTKVSLSMKYVNQKDGTDLDPMNTQLIMESDRRRTGGVTFHHQKIELGAVVNTICSKCGGKGHYAGECWSMGGKTYELLEDDKEDFVSLVKPQTQFQPQPQTQSPSQSPQHSPQQSQRIIGPIPERKENEKKHKEHKKEKKHKHKKDKKGKHHHHHHHHS